MAKSINLSLRTALLTHVANMARKGQVKPITTIKSIHSTGIGCKLDGIEPVPTDDAYAALALSQAVSTIDLAAGKCDSQSHEASVKIPEMPKEVVGAMMRPNGADYLANIIGATDSAYVSHEEFADNAAQRIASAADKRKGTKSMGGRKGIKADDTTDDTTTDSADASSNGKAHA